MHFNVSANSIASDASVMAFSYNVQVKGRRQPSQASVESGLEPLVRLANFRNIKRFNAMLIEFRLCDTLYSYFTKGGNFIFLNFF